MFSIFVTIEVKPEHVDEFIEATVIEARRMRYQPSGCGVPSIARPTSSRDGWAVILSLTHSSMEYALAAGPSYRASGYH